MQTVALAGARVAVTAGLTKTLAVAVPVQPNWLVAVTV